MESTPSALVDEPESDVEQIQDEEVNAQKNESQQHPERLTNNVSSVSSALEEDPFAFREGRHLQWQNVSMSLYDSRKKGFCSRRSFPSITQSTHSDEEPPTRRILDNVWGEVPAQQTTAIMGESGSGKTSLLNILSGRVCTNGNLRVSADIRVNKVSVKPAENIQARKMIAYVEQQDSLNVTSTPREVIRFSAKLRLPRTTSNTKLDQLTKRMLKELCLTKCADTLIGGRLIKGISGGERKRTSVGVELVVKPALVFLDEPTSGLDAANAVQLCQVLKSVANAGAAVLFTIHQPSSKTFNSFDRLILLNSGRIMYQGAVRDVPEAFARNGFPIPNHHNPADFIMEVTQSHPIERLEETGFFPKDNRRLSIESVPESSTLRASSWMVRKSSKGNPNNLKVRFGTQLSMLLRREFKNMRRNVAGLKARAFLTIFMSSLIGLISLNVGAVDLNKASNLQSVFGALMMAAITNVFTVVLPSLVQFPEERPVFIREYSTEHYSVFAYFISRLSMEAIIIGCQVMLSCMLTYLLIDFTQSFVLYYLAIYLLAMASTAMGMMVGSIMNDPSTALEFLPPLFVPQILFAGFFVKPELIPVWLRWVSYLFPLTYTVSILLVLEFDGQCTTNSRGLNKCDKLLNDVGADPDNVWWYWIVLIALFIFFRAAAFVILRWRAHF